MSSRIKKTLRRGSIRNERGEPVAAEANQVETAAEPAEQGDEESLSTCPVCGAQYRLAEEVCCPHFVSDWCFTCDWSPGSPRGRWASTAGTAVLVRFDEQYEELKELLEEDWPSAAQRKRVLRLLPPYLRNIEQEGSWESLLESRIAKAPGYLVCNMLESESMCGDSWNVFWARDGRKAAAAVEAQFAKDLERLSDALRTARTILSDAADPVD